MISSGVVNDWQEIRIVDPVTRREVQNKQVGEIWIKGDSVARGYWENASATEETFAARTIEPDAGPFMRTGDLGFVDGRDLFVTGRLKDVIIVNGSNLYPQDIEKAVSGLHEGFREGATAAFGVDQGGGEHVVVVQEVERTWLRKMDFDACCSAIQRSVNENFQAPVAAVVLIKPMTLPLTSSGKVQRARCKREFSLGRLAVVASRDFCKPRPQVAVARPNGEDAQMSARKTKALLDWLTRFAADNINSQVIDERRGPAPHLIMEFANAGLLGLGVDPDHGGLGLTMRDSMRVLEKLASYDTTLAVIVAVHNYLGVHPIDKFADAGLSEKYLERLAQGRVLGALAITEPAAGSNPNAIQAKATPDGHGGWILTGEKSWIGNGGWAGVINLFVRELDQAGAPVGVTAFAVERDRAGLRIGDEAPTMGVRGMVQNRVHLDGVKVTTADLLGKLGQGMDIAHDAMMQGRLAIAAMCVGAMKRSLQIALNYAQARQISTGKLQNNMVIRSKLADHMQACFAIEAMVAKLATDLDEGTPIPPEMFAAAKVTAPELMHECIDTCMQTLGGRGYTENNHLPQLMRDTRLFRIFEGPTETLAGFLGSAVARASPAFEAYCDNALAGQRVAEQLAEIKGKLHADLDGVSIKHGVHKVQLLNDGIGHCGALILLKALGAVQLDASDPDRLGTHRTWADHRIRLRQAEIAERLAFIDQETHDADFAAARDAILAGVDQLASGRPVLETAQDALLTYPLVQTTESRPPEPATGVGPPGAEPANKGNVAEDLLVWMSDWISKNSPLRQEHIHSGLAFPEAGLDSVASVEFAFDLEHKVGADISPTIIWQFPTVGSLADHLAATLETQPPDSDMFSESRAQLAR